MNELLQYLPGQINQALGSLVYFLPEVYLTILFILVLLTDLMFGKDSAWICRILACAGLLFIFVNDIQQIHFFKSAYHRFLFGDMLVFQYSGVIFKAGIDILSLILLLYFPWDAQLSKHKKGLSDLYLIVIAAILGLHLMVMAVNLLAIFLAIEMVSIASYLLAAYHTENAFSAEGGLKYVLFGAVASAVMLYGISLIYVFTGSLKLYTPELYNGMLLQGLVHTNSLAVSVALILVFAGIGFKLSFIPMHFWVPDVYEGAATPITAWLSTLPKIAAFALLLNFIKPIAGLPNWQSLNIKETLAIIGIITMIAGNFAAVWQTNIKRILAYSSIGHTGFGLMAVAAYSQQAESSLIFYLFVYAIANIGALTLTTFFANVSEAKELKDYSGLGLKYPVAAVCFVIILISLTGLPISGGFNGKLLVFSAVYSSYQQNHELLLLYLLITGAVTTVVSLFYYIKIPLYLFIKKNERTLERNHFPFYVLLFVILVALGLILLGIFPQMLSKFI